ncbi:MAG TPA: RNA-binding protein [Thermoanaerobaculia bacterium]|nr:RNA-binding protein [Thermoanaerobaculia bacterium]
MKLYIGNLSRDMTDADFAALVAPFGTAQSVTLVKDRDTGAPRGFGFVEFQDDSQAKAAISGLNGKEVKGSVLKVNEAQPQKRRF